MTSDEIWAYCEKRKYSPVYAAYWMRERVCVACLEHPSSAPHHIRTRGAGGDDAPENLLALCTSCHRKVDDLGRTLFCRLYPHLKKKVDAAMGRPRA